MAERLRISRVAVWRGLCGRCPRCGKGALFAGWYTLHDRCPACGFNIRRAEPDTWAFMYISTAFLTGLFVVAMFLLRPSAAWVTQVVVLPLALAVIGGSLRWRKGCALAVEYLVGQRLAPEDEERHSMHNKKAETLSPHGPPEQDLKRRT